MTYGAIAFIQLLECPIPLSSSSSPRVTKNTVLLLLPSHDDYHECWVNKYRSFVDPAFVIIIIGREREQNRIFCDRGQRTDRGGIGHSSKLMPTYITKGYIWNASTKYANLYHPLSLCRLASPMCTVDLMKYANLHHPGIYLNYLNRVCQLVSPMCTIDLMKYANLHHPGIYLNCLNQVCQLVSPIILMPTCITHVCPWS